LGHIGGGRRVETIQTKRKGKEEQKEKEIIGRKTKKKQYG